MAGLQPAINLNAELFYDEAPPPQNNQSPAHGALPGTAGAQIPQAQAQDPHAAQMPADQFAALPQAAGALPPAAGAARGNFQAPVCHSTFASLFADPATDPNYE
jgi:hypothetical protein